MNKKNKAFNKKVLIFLLILLFVIYSPYIFFFFIAIIPSKPPKKEIAVDKFLQINSNHTKLLIFPDLTKDNGVVQDCYSYTHYNKYGGNSYEIFSKVKYEESDFQQEKERIRTLVYVSEKLKIEKGVKVDENCVLFNFYTYVAIYDGDCAYLEYASFDFENSEIIYVYVEAVGFEDLTIPHKYLPKELTMGFENDYCHDMYAFCGEKWFGEEYHYE